MFAVVLAADDGIWTGKFTLADVCFLVAFILFIIAFVIRVQAKLIDAAIVAAAFAAVALGWLVL
jgi:hypothetical protein